MAKPLRERFAGWEREWGPEEAAKRLEAHRASQRRWSRTFYSQNQDRVMGWVLGRIFDQQERAAGRQRPLLCEVCGNPQKGKKVLAFDHCHTHGHFRGWLCSLCNWALGNAKDNPDTLRKLADYLDRDRAKNWPKD